MNRNIYKCTVVLNMNLDAAYVLKFYNKCLDVLIITTRRKWIVYNYIIDLIYEYNIKCRVLKE